jgi:hypothetical protein
MSRYTEALTVLRAEECQLKKHHGQTWEWVVDNDPSYAKWAMLNVENLKDEVRDALEAVL